ncbi:unnamed protein product [Rodentolepis nana]|uniref:Uncharacterized protein n=1 Tax=Rodentolepis nana TaxID=102285 RepID=A0A3P7WDF3_RODNA|nr:unnamed protein product [Rodentolepis nana]
MPLIPIFSKLNLSASLVFIPTLPPLEFVRFE